MQETTDDSRQPQQMLRIMLAQRVAMIDDQQAAQLIEACQTDTPPDDALTLAGQPLLDARRTDLLKQLVSVYQETHPQLERTTAQIPTSSEGLADPTSIEGAIQNVLASTSTFAEQATSDVRSESSSRVADDNRFVVKRELARGGLGTIFVAEDRQIPRDVALKEIPEKYAGNVDFTRRFMLEAEVTGALEHPGIVPIYALGSNETGRPYYAMRWIRGQSYRESIDRFYSRFSEEGGDASSQRLAFRKLLSQFISVCYAIHYAHERGVLHRDIKPDNIMLGPNNETVVVDWGIAKIMDEAEPTPEQSNTEPSQDNDSDQQTGVMETLRIRHHDSRAKTTVGVTVGTPAFMSPEQALGWNDTLTPASDVYSLGATLYYLLTGQASYTGRDAMEAVVVARTGEFPKPREIRSEVPRPLEAICLKAMSGSIQDRYSTPVELAEEVEAFLADERVAAWPEPIWSRVRRWFRHHRAALTGVIASLSMGLLMLLTLSIVLTAANTRERRARHEAETQRDRANANFTLARNVVDKYLTAIGEDPRLAAAGLDGLRKELFVAAQDFYQDLVAQSAVDDQLSTDQAWAMFRSAGITHEIETPDQAVGKYRQALAAFERLGVPDGQADSSFNIALALSESGKNEEASKAIDNTIALCRNLLKDHPDNAEVHRREASSLLLKATWLRQSRKLDEAAVVLKRSLDIRQALVEQNKENDSLRAEVAQTLEVMAVLDQNKHQDDEAAKKLDRAHAIRTELVKQHSQSLFHRNALASNLTAIADLQRHRTQLDAAKLSYEKAVAAQNSVIDAVVQVTKYRQRLAQTYNNQGSLLATRGESKAAAQAYEASIRVNLALVGQRPNDPIRRGLLATSYTNLAEIVHRDGDSAAAMKLQVEARTIYQGLFDADRDNPVVRASLVDCGRNIGDLQLAQSQFAEAEKSFQAALELLTEQGEQDNESFRFVFGELHNSLGMLYSAMKQPDKAKQAYTDALAPRERLAKDSNGRPDYLGGLAATQQNLANLAFNGNDLDEADKWFTRAMETLQPAPRNHDECRRVLCQATASRGLVRGAKNLPDQAVVDLQAALKLDNGTLAIAIRLNLSRYQALIGKHREAIVHCRELRTPAQGAAGPLYRLAGSAAICIAAARADDKLDDKKKAELVGEYEKTAAALLSDAHASGYFQTPGSLEQLKSGTEWKAVQNDPWFVKLKAKFQK